MVSAVQSALKVHFETTLANRHHPNTFNFQLLFLRPATAGETIIEIKDVKQGTNMSMVHVRLTQGGADNMVGYAS